MKKHTQYYLWIGLLVVLVSILFEVIREPTNYYKGLFSINIGLLFIFLSIKNKENKPLTKEIIFFWVFICISFITALLNKSIGFLMINDLLITLVMSFSIIISYFFTIFKKINE